MTDLYLVEIAAYDPTVPGAVTLRYGTRGFTTGIAEAPANTFYDYRLKQPVNVTRDCFASGTTSGQSRVGYGDLVLLNADGELDALLTYGFDGRVVTIRHATATDPAYPGDFTTVFVGTMEQPTFGLDEITIRIRDRQYETAVPLQTTKYDGDNALPAGLEGVADDLKGKPKPVCLGAVLNVPAVCVNTSKLIYQVNDGAVASVDGVYDRGIELSDQSAWTLQDPGFTADAVLGLCYGGGLYVAVGEAGKLTTSPDAEVWTARTSQFGSDHILGVAYNGVDLYCCVGAGGKISTSPTGATWTARTSGTAEVLYSVAFGNGTWVAVGSDDTVLTSDDGATWVPRTCALTSGHKIRAVTFGNGVFAVAGDDSRVGVSSDGITWTILPGLSLTVYGLGYGGDRFVATGAYNGTTDDGYAATSFAAGFTFSIVLAFGATPSGHACCYGAGLYLAVGTGGHLVWSADGLAWSLRHGPLANTGDLNACCYGNGVFLVAGDAGELWTTGSAAYANAADLEDDDLAPPAGMYRAYLTGGYFRLGSPPAGLVTADVTQGAAAANRTAAQLANVVLARAIAATSFNAADVAALDVANASVLGHWQGLEETTCNTVLDLIAGSVGAWWGVDQTGDFRIRRLTAPAILHWTTVGDADWTNTGTPTRTEAAATVDGIPLDLIGDNSAAAEEYTRRAMPFTGDGDKAISFIVGRSSAYASQLVQLFDNTAAAARCRVTLDFTTTTLSAACTTGTLVCAEELAAGIYRITAIASGVVAANTNDLYVYPAHGAAADQAAIYIGDIRAYDYAPVAATTFVPSDVVAGSLQRLATLDEGNGLPVYRVTLRWGRNYAVQDTDLAGGVTDARRGVVSKEWREAMYANAAVQTQYLLALATIEDSCFTTAANALTEATRRQVLRGVRRDRYELTVELNAETAALDLGSIVTVQYDRYDLTGAGKQFVIIGIAPDAMARKIRFSLWS